MNRQFSDQAALHAVRDRHRSGSGRCNRQRKVACRRQRRLAWVSQWAMSVLRCCCSNALHIFLLWRAENATTGS